MTYYHQQVLKLTREIYPKEHLCQQAIKAKSFIDTHYAANIHLNVISEQAYLSKFHFIRLFKTMYGQTPHQYLVSVRIEKAKQFLKTGMSITDTCFSVGFSSTTSFTALFKKTTGSTPSAFLARQKLHKK
jgi:AraC-like DNA-binding protein